MHHFSKNLPKTS